GDASSGSQTPVREPEAYPRRSPIPQLLPAPCTVTLLDRLLLLLGGGFRLRLVVGRHGLLGRRKRCQDINRHGGKEERHDGDDAHDDVASHNTATEMTRDLRL